VGLVIYALKQIFVGAILGGLLGPLIGAISGAFAAPISMAVCQVLGVSVTDYVGWKRPALIGTLIGAIVGLPLGLVVGSLIRALSKVVWRTGLTVGIASAIGVVLALACGGLILYSWVPPWESWVMVMLEAVAVGWSTGAAAFLAKPAWAPD